MLLLFGDGLFSYLPSFVLSMIGGGPDGAAPSWYTYLKKEVPMQALSVIFFILPTIVNSMTTTGAFEIVLHYGSDGSEEGVAEKMVTLFSRLGTGQFPN